MRVSYAVLLSCAASAMAVDFFACDRDKAATPGEVMVEITTNLDVPSDLNSVQIVVSANGVTELNETVTVGPNSLALPATVGVVVGSGVDPSTPAKIDVIGYRSMAPQVLAEAVVTIPETGVVVLRMPLDALCLGQFVKNPAAGDGGFARDGGSSSATPYVPSCPKGETCVEGTCQNETVSPGSLSPFDPSDLGGGADATFDGAPGQCFGVNQCFGANGSLATEAAATVVNGQCTLSTPTQNLNIATGLPPGASPDAGLCSPPGEPLAPLPKATGATAGWTALSSSSVALPAAVCKNSCTVFVSHVCPSMTAATPLCTAGFRDDGGTVGSTTGSGSASGTSSGSASSHSGSQGNDSGTSCSSPEECAPSDHCCVQSGASGTSEGTCAVNCTNGDLTLCDGTMDCAQGTVCCTYPGGPAPGACLSAPECSSKTSGSGSSSSSGGSSSSGTGSSSNESSSSSHGSSSSMNSSSSNSSSSSGSSSASGTGDGGSSGSGTGTGSCGVGSPPNFGPKCTGEN